MKRFFVIAFILTALAAHAQDYSYGIDPQRDSVAFARFRGRMDSIRAYRPTVALVLSGGGAKGAAHISVIRYLEQEGIPIDLIMGTSIGGLVSGLYACGYNGAQLEDIIRNQDWDYLLRDTHPRRFDALAKKDYESRYLLRIPFGAYQWDFKSSEHPNAQASPIQNPKISIQNTTTRSILRDGIVQGRNIEDLFTCLLAGYGDECDFLSLPTPFVCVASDMVTAKPKVWHCGSLVDALRSTMSIPGLFTPVKKDGMVLMDGSMRSNFPAEIARQLGADIIIGVDISAPALQATQMNNMMDIIFQAADVLGREAYLAALAATDIYIQPQLSDFSLLSFDKASIDTIIQRGRQAVTAHADEIAALKARLATEADRHPSSTQKTSQSTFSIAEIRFAGIDAQEEVTLRRMLDLPHFVTKADLDDAIATFMGTNAFEKVTYSLLGEKAPYILQFNCYRSPINILGASLRFDTKDFAAILVHLGINACRLTGSRLDLSARLGLKTELGATYTYRSGKAAEFGNELTFQAVRNGAFRDNTYDFRIDFNRLRDDLFFALTSKRRFKLTVGARADYYYRTSILTDYNLPSGNPNLMQKSNLYPGAFALVRSDTFDDPYFPTHGLQYRLAYNYYFGGLLHQSEQTHALQGALRSVHSLGRLTVIPFLQFRYVNNAITPFMNMLSNSAANSSLDQQIPFIGITTPVASLRTLGTLGLNLRTRLAAKHFVTASLQLIHESQQLDEYLKADRSFSYYGLALEYAYNSIVGPIRANIHWSDLVNAPGFYLAIGYDF